MRAIELFSGLGGLGLGVGPGFEVVAAYDQDLAANAAYRANHPAPAIALELASVRATELARHDAPAWLLSPPCQPFTRRGARRDVDDPRCAGLLRLIELLPELRPRRLLLENVVGFHGSRAHGLLGEALAAAGLAARDVETCPSEQGAPVRRPRQFVVASVDRLLPLPVATGPAPAAGPAELAAWLDAEPDPALAIPPGKEPGYPVRIRLDRPELPLATFTRSYGKPVAGAGPVLESAGRLRMFSPDEILRLHGFPPGFSLPAGLPLRTRLRLAGNSVHIAAVRRVAAQLG